MYRSWTRELLPLESTVETTLRDIARYDANSLRNQTFADWMVKSAGRILRLLAQPDQVTNASWLEQPYMVEGYEPIGLIRSVAQFGSGGRILVEHSQMCAIEDQRGASVRHAAGQFSIALDDGEHGNPFNYSDLPQDGVPRLSIAYNTYSESEATRCKSSLFWTTDDGHQVIPIPATEETPQLFEDAWQTLSKAAWKDTVTRAQVARGDATSHQLAQGRTLNLYSWLASENDATLAV